MSEFMFYECFFSKRQFGNMINHARVHRYNIGNKLINRFKDIETRVCIMYVLT